VLAQLKIIILRFAKIKEKTQQQSELQGVLFHPFWLTLTARVSLQAITAPHILV
jgi:hypothetical protein